MPKSRTRKRKHTNRPASLLLNVPKELDKIIKQVEDGELQDALSRLQNLAQRAPRNVEVFDNMLLLGMQLDDPKLLLEAAYRLTELEPHDPIHYYNLFGACQKNMLPGLMLQTGRHLLERRADLELLKDIRETVVKLEEGLHKEAHKQNLPEDSWREVLVLHDHVQVALMLNRYDEALRAAARLLDLAPHFISAYNNRSLAYWGKGEADSAIAEARKALTGDPNNIHARSNLVRFLRLTNRVEEAQAFAQPLRQASPLKPDDWTKLAEAFSYLADDATVLEIVEKAERADELSGNFADPYLLHLAGVAAARLGDEKKARRFWQAAVQRAPSFERAQVQLDDLDKPINERNGAWPFEFNDWNLHRHLPKFVQVLERFVASKNDKAVTAEVRNFLQRHPEIAALMPVLLERGDEKTRDFILQLARLAATPEALAVLKDFALSPHGPFKLRQETMNFLQEQGIFQNGDKVSLWINGERQTVFIHNYKIDDEPYEDFADEAQDYHTAGLEAMRRQDWSASEAALRRALALAPNAAIIQYNLAALEGYRGNLAKSRELMQALAERHPRYVFPRCQLALMALANGRHSEAHTYLKSILALEHFHYAEFATFCKAQILYNLIAEPNREAAQYWLTMWEGISPDEPDLHMFRPLIASPVARVRAQFLLRNFCE